MIVLLRECVCAFGSFFVYTISDIIIADDAGVGD